jgi:hypothetical protein
LRAYVAYYNGSRPHQALENNSPIPREVQPAVPAPFPRSAGSITAISASPDRDRARPRPPSLPEPARWRTCPVGSAPRPRGSLAGRSPIPVRQWR